MIEFFSCSEPGGHVENEDRFEIRRIEEFRTAATKENTILCALADGQGGQAGGALASAKACEASLESATNFPDRWYREKSWRKIVQQADKKVAAAPNAGFTTLIAFDLSESSICGGSNGDSVAVLLDHTGVPRFLTAQQLKNPPIGSGAAAITTFRAIISQPATLLVMSDGVWKFAGLERILEIAREKKGEELIESVKDSARLKRINAFQDDFTFLVFQITRQD